MKDDQIVNLYWQRSEAAISETDNKYGNYCHTIAYNILQNAEDSEECVNDTWLNAWNSMPDKRPARLSPFLGKITRNLAITKGLAKTREKRGGKAVTLALEELDECLASGYDLDSEIEQRELERAINTFVKALPQIEQELFVLRYWYFETEVAIATRKGFSKSKVNVVLKRVRNKLQRYLLQEGLCTNQNES